MPTPRKPAATLAARGTFKHDPKRTRVDVLATGEIGAWRVGSTDPAKVWAELIDGAPHGVLKMADRFALEAATLLLVRMRSAPAKITPAQVTALFNALGKLGCT